MTTGSITRALIQLVQLPLHSLVLFVVVSIAMRVKGRDRATLCWFAGGLAAGILTRTTVLLDGAARDGLALVGDGLLPIVTSVCFLVAISMWWRARHGR